VQDAPVAEDSHAQIEAVYRKDGVRLWRAVFMTIADREVASDAVAEAFAQALARGSAIRAPGPWVWKAAFRIAAGQMKERRKTEPISGDVAHEIPEATVELLDMLAVLSPKQRASVVLHYYAGYPLGEVASLIGSTRPAVGVHLSRARAKLRRVMEAEIDG
jgi:RNA polymerase sigma-70 factor (ECF subfamily)